MRRISKPFAPMHIKFCKNLKYSSNTVISHLIVIAVLLFGCEDNIRTETQKSFFVNQTSITMFIGEELLLTASPTDGTYDYQWNSEDPSIVIVNKDGLVKAVGEGTTFVVVEAGNLTNMIEVISKTKIPLESVSLSESRLELLYNDIVKIIVSYFPENYNYASEIVWYSEDPTVALVDNGEVTITGEGETNIVFKSGDIIEKIAVDGKYTRPFMGPYILSSVSPCEILAVNFDFGGEGYAFHDNEMDNRTGSDNYRYSNGDLRGTPVEIEGNGTNIGYTAANEWLVYTVNVQDAGVYYVEASVSANGADARFHIEVNNENVTGTIHIPNNGSWSNWNWQPVPSLLINLDKGEQRVKFYIENSGFNFRALRFTKK